MTQKKILMWFRQDLRVKDNPALNHATALGDIIPIYIFDDKHPKKWQQGSASKWWLHHSLESLNQSLAGKLILLKGDPIDIVSQLVEEAHIDMVVWNRCYEPWQISRDMKLKKVLLNRGVHSVSFNASLLWEPWEVLKKDNSPYKVFTPYYRRGCLSAQAPRLPEKPAKRIRVADHDIAGLKLQQLALIPETPWFKGFAETWSPGEDGAADRLQGFLGAYANSYMESRNIPNIPGTSKLSPHLHFGEISPNQIWYAAIHAFSDKPDNEDLACFLSELGWREFSYYLLYHFPSLPEKNFQAKFDQFDWKKNKKLLTAWQHGKTGIPIIDAGMRELWQTGYMHNRVRMIVGSFLVKNLRIHWREGAAWFWDCLLDADLASNSASWQWVAGSGADAAPYFRIFNPVTQGERFDPNGDYVKRYCPELQSVTKRYIHQPWQADTSVLRDAGVSLGIDYPRPIVDLKLSRQEALNAFSHLNTLSAEA